MAAFAFNTNLSLGQDGNTAAADVDDFRTILDSISGGAIQPSALANSATAIADVKSGAINFCLTSATSPLSGTVADHLNFTHEFGMELPEYISWWYEGGGQALFQGLLDTAAEGVYQFHLVLRAAESGGWFREALTLKKMLDGQYSDGTVMRFRAFGTHQAAMNLAFPNIVTPAVTAGVSELGDIFGGNFTGGEFNEPYGDASPLGGLFPNYPAKTGSIIEALGGRPHYYVGSYHTPFRARVLLVNKAWFDGLAASAQDQIKAAARYCVMRNIAHSMQGGDAIIKVWQGLGAVIHRSLPRDVLDRFRTAIGKAQDTIAASDASYNTVLQHQRAFMKANAVRWSALPDRAYRVARTTYETDLKVDA